MKSFIFLTISLALLFHTYSARADTTIPFPNAADPAHEYLPALLCYIANGVSSSTTASHQDCLAGTSVSIVGTHLPMPLELSLQELARDPEANPGDFLEWWDRAQPVTIGLRRQENIVTPTLQAFSERTGYGAWSRTVLNISLVKYRTRVIYRSPPEFHPALSVAVTYDTQNGDLNAPVRETEIAVEREDGSGNADFYSYDHSGVLSPMSLFPSGIQPVPSSCLSCHFRRNVRIFPREGL